MRPSKKVGLFILSFILALLVIAGCAQAASPAATKPADTGPKYGGTIRLAARTWPPSMDPNLAYEPYSASWAKLYSAGLIRPTGKTDSEFKIVPWLAKSWEYSPDAKILTFKLQEGVKFQNLPPVNGREVTADDFKYGLDRIMDPKTRSPNRPALASIDHVDVVDKYTLKIFYKNPDPGLLIALLAGSSTVQCKEVIERDGSAAKTLIGPGPFIAKELTQGTNAVFEKNPDYFEKGKPYLDKIEVYVIPDEASQLAAFRAGQLDRFLASKTSADAAKSTVPNTVLVPGADPRGNALYMNIPGYPKTWGDVRVRKAISYAIDYDGIIKAAFESSAYRSDLLGPLYKDWGARTGDQLPKQDIAKAKALLAEAGYPNGFKTSMIANNVANIFAAAEPIVAMLKQIGIDCEIKPMDTASFQAANKTGDFDLCWANAQLEKADADLSLRPLYYSNGTQNYSKYNNPTVDKLIDQQQGTIDPVARGKIVRQIMTILQDEQPIVPICVQYGYWAMQGYVKGWDNNADPWTQFGFSELLNVWLDK
jgi:peptide/nickel transport system substrate-binding protein